MNKLTGLLLSLVAMAGLANAQEALKIDFGPSATANIEAGYSVFKAEAYSWAITTADFVEKEFDAFGTKVKIKPVFPTTGFTGARGLDRDVLTYTDTLGAALVRDWVGASISSSGNPIKFVITGLPNGNYSWMSYHHDTSNQTTAFVATITDGVGTKVSPSFTGTQSANGSVTTWAGVGKYSNTIVSNGADPVTVSFQVSSGFFVLNGFDIVKLRDNGGAYDPVPVSGTVLDIATDKRPVLSWSANVDDPNVLSFVSYDLYFGLEGDPNVGLNDKYTVTNPTWTLPYDLSYDKTYYWRVDTLVKWDTNIPNTVVKGSTWKLTTLPDDLAPEVKADADDKNVLTWVGNITNITGKVANHDENDIVDVKWEIYYDAAMQLIPRTGNANLANLGVPADLMVDWIGTDNREVGDPMTLTLKGLPAGTYTWKSYHHDPSDQNGTFSVTVTDVNGTSAATSVTITAGATTPVKTFDTTITANGTDPVVLTFDQTSDGSSDYTKAMFVMNGFELTATSGATGSLMIDFSDATTPVIAAGYQAYVASHEVASTFTEQSYTAFGKTVSVKPTWVDVVTPKAVISDTTNSFNSTAQSAQFKADKAGTYRVRLTATDAKQTVSEVMQVQVVADACAAAQLISGFAFNVYDVNKDCKININDVADFAKAWLNDRRATSQVLN